MSVETQVAGPFRLAVVVIAAAYCAIQLVYIGRLPLVMDEFAGEREVWRLLREVPYRDYLPYKNVLGYYVEAAPLLLIDTIWSRVMAIKTVIVVINAIVLAAAGFVLARFFRRSSVLLALLLLVCCSTFLERSSELRVDMLTAWCGLGSLLLLLGGRWRWAGALCGASFLVSQKGAIYFAAANAVFFVQWLYSRERRSVGAIASFNGAVLAVIAAYVAFWSAQSSLMRTIEPMFLSAAEAAKAAGYEIRSFWAQVLRRDPLVFLFAFAGMVQIGGIAWRNRTWRETCVSVYGFAILLIGAIYPQPWPYFFVLLFPTLFVVHAAWFHELQTHGWSPRARRAFFAVTGFVGIVYPLLRVPVVLARDQSYQRYTVELAAAILRPGDTYLAGVPMIQEHRQHERLAWLDAIQLRRLHDGPPERISAIVRELQLQPPKVIIMNYRLRALPRPITDHLYVTYARVSASVYVYATLVQSGKETLELPFGGRYLVDTARPAVVRIDGMEYATGRVVELSPGRHIVETETPLRLRNLPKDVELTLDAQFMREQELFPNVYTY